MNFRLPISRRKLLMTGVIGVPAAAALQATCLEPNWLKVRTVRLNDSPAHRLVHFTDLHFKGDTKMLEKTVAAVNALEPDTVCFTGDLVEDSRHASKAMEAIGRIKAPVYGVPGNHDYWAEFDFAEMDRVCRKTGGRWLLDESVQLNNRKVNLIGLSCTTGALINPKPGFTNVLLIHYPAWVKKLESRKFDLALAGHSHGGQVRLPFAGAIVLPWRVDEYDLGMFRTPWGPLYVGAGIGYFYFNFRFNCRPEVTLFEI